MQRALQASKSEVKQRLSSGGLKPLSALIAHLGLQDHFRGDAVLHGADPIIRSPHRLGEASAMAQLLIGAAGAAVCRHVGLTLRKNGSIIRRAGCSPKHR